MPASVTTTVEVDWMRLVMVLAGWLTVVISVLSARFVMVTTLPVTVEKSREVVNEVDRIVDVAGFKVVAGRPALVLTTVTQAVGPVSEVLEVFVKDVIVELRVRVVVPAARASRPLRKRRAAEVGAQVMVVFFVEI